MKQDKLKNLRLYDNTRITAFKKCPRYYFFRHVRGWERGQGLLETALAFGGAWHEAMDSVWLGIAGNRFTDKETIVGNAYQKWVGYWVKAGMPHPDEMDAATVKSMLPRVPAVALDMLYGYVATRMRMIGGVELVEVERPFAVPLTHDDPTLFYIGRIDKIVSPGGGVIRAIEHKTTTMSQGGYGKYGSDPKIRGLFLESFSPNSQVDGYLFALNFLYEAKAYEVWVDAALVHKAGEDFHFVPVEKQMAHINSWLSDTHYWVERIEKSTAHMEDESPVDSYMAAFPKNTSACLDYNRTCPFIDLCKARANPLSWDEAPSGFKVNFWNPLDHIGTPAELKEDDK